MLKPSTPILDYLTYLQDLGFEDLMLRPALGDHDLPAEAEARAELALVESEAAACTRCPLAAGRRNVVFGSGDVNADLMFVGEGPGAREDEQGLPFVGPAGALLTKIVAAMGLDRSHVYIANMVKCRPPGNRDPEADELAACRRFIDAQIDLVRPRVIVALGRVAAQSLMQTSASLGALRERWHSVRGIPARATYHPAALLRYEKYKRPTWDDMRVVRDHLQAARDDGYQSTDPSL